ncbi:VCBS domain-containing protein, partial [Pseudovibrio sp. JE062]|uniref:VCBS domain-containing protein n=1 Tax=Pseudovibrio sp. JE062 TaxID=439495 RepID=UPI000186C2EE
SVSKLVASDGASGDSFGASVSVNSAGSVVVGARYDDQNKDMSNSGSVYVYASDGQGGVQQVQLTASDGIKNGYFGHSAAINDAGIVAVSAYGDDDKGNQSGSVYVYRPDGSGGYSEFKITASDGAEGDRFGYQLALNDSGVVVVGARYDDHSTSVVDAGSVYVYTPDSYGGYSEVKLVASDGAKSDYFGHSLSINDAGIVAVGAYSNDDKGKNSGSVYVYRPDGEGGYSEVKLVASDGAEGDVFGYSVAVNDSGAIVVGAHGDDDKGESSGSVYVYRPDGEGGYSEVKLTASDGALSDNFGYSVASNQSGVIVVGAHNDDDHGNGSGSAYVYVPDGNGGYTEYKLTAPDGVASAYFGYSVAINDAGVITVGAHNDKSQGASYVFQPDASGAYGVINEALVLDESTDLTPLSGDIEIVFADEGVAVHTYQASVTGVSSSGPVGELTTDALLALLSVDDISKNPGAEQGSVHLDFTAASTVFDYLDTDETLTLTYTVELDNGNGALTTQQVTVTINGKDDLGTSNSDTLVGESQNDILDGLTGSDVLTGSSGSDIFVFRNSTFGNDTITDFEAGAGSDDTIRFDSDTFADFDAVIAAASDEGSSVVITVDDHNSVTLNNVSMSELHTDDFQFV